MNDPVIQPSQANSKPAGKRAHVVARVSEITPGGRKRVEAAGRQIALFNLNGEFFAIADRCPHESGSLCDGKITGLAEADEPGKYRFSRPGEFIKCPWHGWEFDIRTGQSRCDPAHVRVRAYDAHVEHGADLVQQSYRAETFAVTIEEDYVVLHI